MQVSRENERLSDIDKTMAPELNTEKSPEVPDAKNRDASIVSPDGSANEPDQGYLKGTKLAMVMTSVIVAIFLDALDRTIIATAIPKITDEFHALDDVGWYASAYLITSCATQLLWGRINTFYPSKLVFLSAIAIFELGSVLCGAAPNSNAFILGRAIAGLGSAGIFSGATMLVAHVIPLHKRPVYIGAMGSIFGVSSIIGPLLGGVFTDKVTWRWCFYINLPLGAISAATVTLVLKSSPVSDPIFMRQKIARLDPFGTLAFLPGIICYLLAIEWGGTTYPWSNGRIIALFVLAGILSIAFIIIQQWQQENATVRPRIIKNRSIYCGVLYSSFVNGAMISLVYYLPLWFQAVKGTSAVRSGINTLPMVLSLVVGAITAGAIVTRTGWYNPWMFFCTTFMSIGTGLITTLKTDTSTAKWIGYQIIFGLGLGTGMQQSSLAAQALLAKEDVSTGVSLMFFARSLGGALFVSIGQSLFNNDLRSSLLHVSGIDTIAVVKAGPTELRRAVTPENLALVLTAYNAALTKAFVVALAASCASVLPALGMEWRRIRKDETGRKSAEEA